MSSLKIDIKGLDKAIKGLEIKTQTMEKRVEKEIHYFGFDVMSDAKKFAPADEGYLRNRIDLIKTKLTAEVVVNAIYAAYMEFGTGKWAAEYVATLPADWKSYSEKFKGGGNGGSFDEMVKSLFEWIQRKNIRPNKIGTQEDNYNKGKLQGNKKPKKQSIEEQQQQLAYVFAISILKNGVKPQPFLYPAFLKNKQALIDKIKSIVYEGL